MTTTTAKDLLIPRVDAPDKATGQAVYVEDLPLPTGTLYGRFLRSPYSHAIIRSINAEKAEKLPGVHAVLTREHLQGLNPHVDPSSFGEEGEGSRSLIAMQKVRFEGELVAAVAAESPAIAQAALALIDVDYEELPGVFEPREASKPRAPLLHEKRTGNHVGRFDFGWGDVEHGFRESDHIFEDTYVFQSVFHHPMENVGGCIAEVRGDTLELTAAIQHQFRPRDQIADIFGFDRNKVRIKYPYVGGGFGAKEMMNDYFIAILFAIRTGRPVTLLPSAEESFRSDCRHSVVYNVKTGVKANGTIVAVDIDMVFDKGAYGEGSMNVPRRASSLAWGPYKTPHLRVVSNSYYTNKVPAGAFRSLGRAQTTWGYESHYDTIARKLNMDPNEFRLKNFLKRGDMIIDTTGPFDSDMDDLLERTVKAIGWDGRASRIGPESDTPYIGTKPVRGKGLSTTFRHGYSGTSVSNIEVTCDDRGVIRVLQTGAEIGQGIYAMLSRVVSATLGVPESKIEITHPTTDGPFSAGIGSGRDTVSMGMAAQRACEDMKKEIINIASKGLGGEPEEWRVAEGRLWHGEKDYSMGDVVASLGQGLIVAGKGHYSTPRADNAWQGVVPHWELSVGAAEVEVDPETGEVKLLQYVTVADVGTAVHPQSCKTQLQGGAVMGLGNAMYEEMVYANGQFLNGDPMQYRLPLMEDLAEHFDAEFVENHDGPGPMGSKSVGQTGVSPIAPAIANAIYEAIGVRIRELPITPEKVLRGLGKL